MQTEIQTERDRQGTDASPRRPTRPTTDGKEHVIIVGGGAGGAELAAALGRRSGRSAMNVTLVDCAPSHLWKPRLHEVAAGLLGAGEDEISYLALGRANRFQFHIGALTGLDPVAKTVSISAVKDTEGGELLGPRELHYDTLVLAFGSQVNDFGVPGVVEHCQMLDSGDQAIKFQRRLLEMAVKVSAGACDRLRVGIVGAGATGVELAAELHDAVRAMHRYGGLMSPEQLDITVIDMAPRVLPSTDPATSAFAAQTLDRMGVTMRLNAGVEQVTADGFILKGGGFAPCDLKVWASGVIGRPIASTLPGLKVDRSRRITCDDHMRCEGLADVYALGDCALVRDPKTQRPLPATAQVAHQQATYLARLFSTPARDGHAPFSYQPRGSLISLGTEPAAGEIPVPKRSPITFSGATPKLLYVSLELMHRAALIGWSQAMTEAVIDGLRRTTAAPVKLH
jgi:NADH:ubiquinone reductase (H+-translocating)